MNGLTNNEKIATLMKNDMVMISQKISKQQIAKHNKQKVQNIILNNNRVKSLYSECVKISKDLSKIILILMQQDIKMLLYLIQQYDQKRIINIMPRETIKYAQFRACLTPNSKVSTVLQVIEDEYENQKLYYNKYHLQVLLCKFFQAPENEMLRQMGIDSKYTLSTKDIQERVQQYIRKAITYIYYGEILVQDLKIKQLATEVAGFLYLGYSFYGNEQINTIYKFILDNMVEYGSVWIRYQEESIIFRTVDQQIFNENNSDYKIRQYISTTLKESNPQQKRIQITQEEINIQPDDICDAIMTVSVPNVTYDIQFIARSLCFSCMNSECEINIMRQNALVSLSLTQCKCGSIEQAENLKNLNLCAVTFNTFDDFKSLRKLSKLYIFSIYTNGKKQPGSQLMHSIYNCKDLQYLYILYCQSLAEITFNFALPKLRVLCFWNWELNKVIIDLDKSQFDNLEFILFNDPHIEELSTDIEFVGSRGLPNICEIGCKKSNIDKIKVG